MLTAPQISYKSTKPLSSERGGGRFQNYSTQKSWYGNFRKLVFAPIVFIHRVLTAPQISCKSTKPLSSARVSDFNLTVPRTRGTVIVGNFFLHQSVFISSRYICSQNFSPIRRAVPEIVRTGGRTDGRADGRTDGRTVDIELTALSIYIKLYI